MKTYQKRFSIACDYWIEKGAPPSAARDLAHEQIDFEDKQSLEEENAWKSPNDSLPIYL